MDQYKKSDICRMGPDTLAQFALGNLKLPRQLVNMTGHKDLRDQVLAMLKKEGRLLEDEAAVAVVKLAAKAAAERKNDSLIRSSRR